MKAKDAMNSRLNKLLVHLSETLNSCRQAETDARYRRALDWETLSRPPLVATYPLPDETPFVPYPHREVFDDPEKMLYNELVHAFDTSIALHPQLGDDLPLTVRANFGTVLTASMFGAPVQQIQDNPPWIVHAEAHEFSLEQIADTDPLDFTRGWIPRASETMQIYHQLFDEFSTLKERIRIVLPDLQGPFDNLELIRGSDVFLDLTTQPTAVSRAMNTLATAQIGLAKHFGKWTTEPKEGFCHQHAVMLKGNILLRNDSCIMVSPKMYQQQIAPHDQRVLCELGGGGIHACGAVEHLVDAWLQLPSICSLDLGQPELNDLDAIYAKAAARQVPLIRLAVSEKDIRSGSARDRFPTGVVLVHRADHFEAACRVIEESAHDSGRDFDGAFRGG
jgi:hypothetical protein